VTLTTTYRTWPYTILTCYKPRQTYLTPLVFDIRMFRRLTVANPNIYIFSAINLPLFTGSHGRDRMVVGFTTICAISASYHH